MINAYVTEKGLKNGQHISLDATLKSLLNPPEGVQITFLNIQKYINPHYIKEVKPAAEPKKEKKPAATPPASPAPAPAAKPAAPRPTLKKAASTPAKQ
jgi:hypothetical protein